MNRRKLSADETVEKLKELDGWNVDGVHLKKRFEFEDFASSLAFVITVSEIAEERDHHPDVSFGWGYVEIALTTHDTGGLTEFDFAVATEIGEI